MAKVEQATGEVARQKALVANAHLAVDRLTPLYEKKAASKKDLDNATANKLATEASLLSAQANLLDAQINLGYTTIASPITGYADRAKLREGALINPASNSLLTTVSRLDPIWVYFTVSDNDILQVRQKEAEKLIDLPESLGQMAMPKNNAYDVEVSMSDGSAYPHRGKVSFASPTYDQSTGTILVRGVFPNPDGDLRPGQFVRVKVYGANMPNALVVPQRALMQKSTGMYVYRINEEGQPVAQDVSTGQWYGNYQVVTNGLKAGETIIVDGINKIRPGIKIEQVGAWTPK
jgi:membrane fusion protein (multidrug efflux system)